MSVAYNLARHKILVICSLIFTSLLIIGYAGHDQIPNIYVQAQQHLGKGYEIVKERPLVDDQMAHTPRANAAFVILTRNGDLGSIMTSMQQMEDRFNRRYHYPYIFLNDETFDDKFIASVSALASGNCSFGKVPSEHWEEPNWIDGNKAARARQDMGERKIIYGDSQSYRRMCRFYSGFFFKHPLLESIDWYWRIDPDVKFFCDLDYDPFLYMMKHKKQYGFAVSIKEYVETIPTLWDTTKKFMQEYPQHVVKDNSLTWVSNDAGDSYNLCHFWSNFEIGSLAFLRSKPYQDYFSYLDKSGGFSYERWGDAPVHSIAAALFLRTDQIHFFQDIGYRHNPWQQCPPDAVKRGCACDPTDSFEYHWYSCTQQWKELLQSKKLEIGRGPI